LESSDHHQNHHPRKAVLPILITQLIERRFGVRPAGLIHKMRPADRFFASAEFLSRPADQTQQFPANFARSQYRRPSVFSVTSTTRKVGMNFRQSHTRTSGRKNQFIFENLEDRRLLAAYLGTPFVLNQRIEAEHFDTGGEAVAYHDLDAANVGGALRLSEGVDIAATTDSGGGFVVTSTQPTEYLSYTVTVPTTGNYTVETRVASNKIGGSFHYEWKGQNVSGGIPIPNTGSLQTYWTLKTGPIPLSAGTSTLRLVFNSPGTASLGNFNWLRVIPYGTSSGDGGGGTVGTGTGLRGTYYNNMDFTGTTSTRTDAKINFNWDSRSPAPFIAPDTFSVRWTGKVQAQKTERYTFYTRADDGVRLWVNGQLLINCWNPQPSTEYSASINLVAGQKYDIKLEYFQRYGGASVSLSWSSATTTKQLVPTSQLYTS
jgi:hypothetical protein